jgi:hypothetical protein
MANVLLTEQDVQKLNAFIQELPVKHGIPLLNILQEAARRGEESPKEETPVVDLPVNDTE